MIKIGQFLYIHFTVIFLFAVCYFNRNLEILLISYATILLHELAHLAAAVIIGLKPSHIAMLPFGVNLKLKNSLVYSIADEILLYLSGPLFNIIMALFLIPMLRYGRFFQFLYYNNLALFLFNILPILPMDGGVVLKKILARKIGYRQSEKLLRMISAVLILFLIILQIYLVFKSKFNFSVLFAVIFLTGNLFTNKEKYYLDFAKELIFYKNKSQPQIKKVKGYLIKETASYRELAKNFSQGSHYIIFKENNHGKITSVLTEREIIEEILK
ncbi:MAG: site-2 protease family protein [Clostridia bacterium]|nr:site-2 protease family protein [Clostridia bacterium]